MDGKYQEVTKFFVTNLPEGCTPWDLRQGLEGFEDIVELEKSLRGAKLGSAKLKINIAKFALENSGFSVQQEVKKSNHSSSRQEDRSRLFNLRDVRSYSDVLGKSKVDEEANLVNKGTKVVDNFDISKVLIVPDRTTAFKELFGVAVVGRTMDLETLVDLDKLLRIAKVSYTRIQYLGGLSILISFLDVASTNRFLESGVIWDPWFTKLEALRGQSLPLERVAWLKLHGIPLHLLEDVVLMQLGELFGKVLHIPKSLEDDQDLLIVMVGVQAGEAFRIGEVVTLN
ncbi:hypothetical protein Hdeb2414_s0017g00509811 [Helianthus debilis subsp. tardiflorus]